MRDEVKDRIGCAIFVAAMLLFYAVFFLHMRGDL